MIIESFAFTLIFIGTLLRIPFTQSAPLKSNSGQQKREANASLFLYLIQ